MPARIRNWYSVYRIGDAEPSIIVSAFSVTGIKCYLKENPLNRSYKIIPTKTWTLAKVFSGAPLCLPSAKETAPNHWYMTNDDRVYHVVILN